MFQAARARDHDADAVFAQRQQRQIYSTGRLRDNHHTQRYDSQSKDDIRAQSGYLVQSSCKRYSAAHRADTALGRPLWDKYQDRMCNFHNDLPLAYHKAKRRLLRLYLKTPKSRTHGSPYYYVCLAILDRLARQVAFRARGRYPQRL